MVNDFLFLLLGLDIGTASPHLAVLANDALTLAWSSFMSELRTTLTSFAIEGVIALVILWFLRRIDNREKAERAADRKAITDSIDNLANQIRLERESGDNNSEPKCGKVEGNEKV